MAWKLEIYKQIQKLVPVYRRSSDEIEDLVQEFFAEFLLGNYIEIYKKCLTDEHKSAFMKSFVKKRCLRQMTMEYLVNQKNSDLKPEIIAKAINGCPNPERELRASQIRDGLQGSLPPREMRVVQLLVEGCNYREISEDLDISLGTVSNIVLRVKENPWVKELVEFCQATIQETQMLGIYMVSSRREESEE